jgi:hypothetical protein
MEAADNSMLRQLSSYASTATEGDKLPNKACSSIFTFCEGTTQTRCDQMQGKRTEYVVNLPSTSMGSVRESRRGFYYLPNSRRVPKCFTLWQENMCTRSKAWLAASVWLRLLPPPASRVRPARHACGCTRPSRARFGHRNRKIVSDGSKT